MTEVTLRKVKIWDAPVRLFHWSLVLLVLLSFITGEFGGLNINVPRGLPGGGSMIANMTLHMWSGLAILTLVLFRLGWGVFGSTTAQFATFVRGPAAIARYLRGLRGAGPVVFVAGHNPAGALMVVGVLALLLLQASTGLFLKEDDFFGFAAPLNGLVSESTAKTLGKIHGLNWTLIATLVILHILANLYYWLVRKENLIGAMFTGRRLVPDDARVPALRFAPTLLALLFVLVAGVLVWAITRLGG